VGYFVYVSIGWNVIVSLTDWNTLKPNYEIKGFSNYVYIFNNPEFWTSLQNNLVLILLFVPLTILLGLFLAILLDSKVLGEGVFRTIYLLPFSLSFVITGTLWLWMYNPGPKPPVGVINTLLEAAGLGFLRTGWSTDPSIALYCVILALAWQFSGYAMLIFLAGIKSIPESQVMAAAVDGARGFRLYWRIVIPQLKTSLLATFVVLMIFALKAFDFIYVLTGIGRSDTFTLPFEMYKLTFGEDHYAYGAAVATVLFIMVMIIVVPYLYMSSRRRER
jgi:glucose/mannose transport system permease protein